MNNTILTIITLALAIAAVVYTILGIHGYLADSTKNIEVKKTMPKS